MDNPDSVDSCRQLLRYLPRIISCGLQLLTGNAEACRVLVAAGADVDSADKDGLSALHCAASRGHSDCVRMLVGTCKARVDPVDKNQCTPLFYATTLGHDQCAQALLEMGASPNHTDSRGRT